MSSWTSGRWFLPVRLCGSKQRCHLLQIISKSGPSCRDLSSLDFVCWHRCLWVWVSVLSSFFVPAKRGSRTLWLPVFRYFCVPHCISLFIGNCADAQWQILLLACFEQKFCRRTSLISSNTGKRMVHKHPCGHLGYSMSTYGTRFILPYLLYQMFGFDRALLAGIFMYH